MTTIGLDVLVECQTAVVLTVLWTNFFGGGVVSMTARHTNSTVGSLCRYLSLPESLYLRVLLVIRPIRYLSQPESLYFRGVLL